MSRYPVTQRSSIISERVKASDSDRKIAQRFDKEYFDILMNLLIRVEFPPVRYLLFIIIQRLSLLSEETCEFLLTNEYISFLYNTTGVASTATAFADSAGIGLGDVTELLEQPI